MAQPLAEDPLVARANELDRDGFVAAFGPLVEHSPWVAAAAYDQRPFADRDQLLAAVTDAMLTAPRNLQLGILRAHPELAGRAAVAGTLTPDSEREQASAGLDRLTPVEHDELTRVTGDYRERFGFPFVICVREHDRASILAAARERLQHDPAQELRIALREVGRIAALRLGDLP